MHTSIVFCHGIGGPRQYLSAANFIDALDEHGNREDPCKLGYIRQISGEIEVSSHDDRSFRNYIDFTRFQYIKNKPRPVKRYRVYEAYWAGDQHRRSSLFEMLIWVSKIVITFILTSTSRWRKYPTHKRRILNKMTISGDHRRKIEKLYSEFDNGAGRKLYSKGSFREFQDHLSAKASAQDRIELKRLAASWRREVLKSNANALLKTAVVSAPILAFLFFVYMLFFSISIKLIGGVEYKNISTGEASHLAALIATLLAAFMGWMFSKRLISDVMAWTTTHESHESFLARERRVNLAKDLLHDVLADPNCVRCVLVGHSLGSAIILDAFLRLNAHCRATNILECDRDKSISEVKKVSHIFTIGSPIQKIASLFYADSGEHHRYHRVRHSNPYLLDRPAWGEHGGPIIINLWSRYDLISSKINALQKVMMPGSMEENIIGAINIEVAPNGAPFPLSAHSGYFKDPSSMAVIYQAIASGNLSKTRMLRAEFKSSIPGWEKFILSALFVLSLVLAGVWMSTSVIDGWLAVAVTFMVLISLGATFATIRRDYRRHRGDA